MAIKKRNPAFVLIISMITFGIYLLYWAYSTGKELKEATLYDIKPWFIFLCLIPGIGIIFALIFWWEHSKAINILSGFSNALLFVLWIIFSPAAIVIAQMQLNKHAIPEMPSA